MTLDEPLLVTFDVGVPVEHAFDVWTTRAGLWWPRGHTVSGDPESVVFEPYVGGRIVERGPDGREHVWGEVTEWNAPHRLGFRWHLFFDADSATDVTMLFEPYDDGTRIRLEQSGFERLGESGAQRREGTVHGWAATAAAYRVYLEA
jgi:uncharacterized protein YndB with AHSA1/START domain